ncbi:MAG TPA: hypothetical protein VJT73_00075, partial [Polyangiaceae bacterium]|nr:hypothetical protein [Polyangiaceae bacterium]
GGRFNSGAPVAPPRPGPSVFPRAEAIPRAPAPPVDKGDPTAPLREQIEQLRRTIATRDAEARTLVTQRDARIADLEAARMELAKREAQAGDLERQSEGRAARIAELEKELASLRIVSDASGDDLKQIRGIGPAFERELRRNGVRTLAQIATWTSSDVDTMARKIRAKPERIRRDDWVGHAAQLVAAAAKPKVDKQQG